MIWQRIAYGTLFVIVLPFLLIVWATFATPKVAMPVYGSFGIGTSFAILGLGVVFAGTLDLWRFGGGLPMNAFPPPHFVSRGIFRYVPHPIYAGFVAVCLGVSMIGKSASGLWLVTPSVALGCTALVLGYEHVDLNRRFSRTLALLPVDEEAEPSTLERIRFLLLVALPWLALYEFTIQIPTHGAAFKFAFEDHIAIMSWTVLIYESVYLAVAVSPWCARTRRELRQLMISGWVATALVFPCYWFFPSAAPRRALSVSGWLTRLLQFERTTYPPVAALPSFHVLWALIVARLYRPRWLGFGYVAAVAISCVTTGMHYVIDVVWAFAIAPAVLEPQSSWELLRRAAERLANSWREWRIGPIRIINYALYAGLAALVQFAIVLAAVGPVPHWKVLVTCIVGLVAAAAWAQWVEGSSLLRRPFGFYGALIGVGLSCLFFRERWILLGAQCLAGPWTQAIGRLRCLVNGCCHGRATSPVIGVRVNVPRSRVVYMSRLAGVPIHATQLYSIAANVFLGLLLSRLWVSGCSLSWIVGIYGIGNGVGRFIEEAYRGEPQTPVLFGLRLYQWTALATVVAGAVITTLTSPSPPHLQLSLNDVALASAFGLFVAAAMGVDFPESNRSFARLT